MKNTALLIIDPQNDFMDDPAKPGSLAVAGAKQDMARLSDYISAHASSIDAIVITLDTHAEYDIGHATYWKNAAGEFPTPFTVIEAEDIISGKYSTSLPEKKDWAIGYARALETQGKYKITVWPTHCLDNSYGYAVEENLAQTVAEWEKTKGLKAQYVKKGMNPDTENYSVFKAEVPISNDPTTQLNTHLISELSQYKEIKVAGEALSHCVASSVQDLVDVLPNTKISSVGLLTDCMSSVGGFEKNGLDFIENMKNKGVNIETTVKNEEKIIVKTAKLSF